MLAKVMPLPTTGVRPITRTELPGHGRGSAAGDRKACPTLGAGRDWRVRVVHHRGAALSTGRPVGTTPCRAPGLPATRGARMTAPTFTSSTVGNSASTAFRAAIDTVAAVEPRIAAAMQQELTDQRESLKLIASENYASPAVLLAMGSWLSDKYAEGTVGRRFYAGCRNVGTVEALAPGHAEQLFGAQHAYVQPHSGIDANLVAFWATLAARTEAPTLAEAGLRSVNDLDEQ